MTDVAPRRTVARRLVSAGIAVAAVAFVAWMVPIRDRCWDPNAPRSTRVSVSRDVPVAVAAGGEGANVSGATTGCVLHLHTGDVPIASAECARLTCEPGVASTFRHADALLLVALFALYMLGTVAWAARWRALLAFAGVDLPLGAVWRISVEAQAGGILLPGGIGGDALRIASILARPASPASSERAGTPIVVASVLLDRAIGLAFIAGVAVVLGLAAAGGGVPSVAAGPLLATLAAIPLGVFAGLVVLRRAPLERFRWLTSGKLGRAVTPVLAYVRDPRAPRAMTLAALLSFLVAGTQFAVVRGLLLALGAAPNAEKWIYVGTAMAFIVSAIPALPGAWGTADATYVFFFGMAGIASGVALAVCLLYRSFWYLSGLLGALLHARGAARGSESANQAAPRARPGKGP